MATKVSSRFVRNRFVRPLSIENLESRINLSTFGVLANAPRVQTANPGHSIHRTTSASQHQAAITLATSSASTGNTASPTLSQDLLFGDTAVASSSATSIDVTSASTLTGAQLEWINGVPDIGYMSASGADIEYTLNVAAAGTYQLNVGVASLRWGTFDLLVNGATQAQYSFNATNSWRSYETTSQTVTLNAGTNIIRVNPTWTSQFNINAVTLNPVAVTSGAGTTVGASASVPVTSYSAISNSQIEYHNGQPDVGYVSPSGGYVEYTLNVQNAGNYNVSIGAAAPNWAQTNLSVNGTQAASYYINSTGAWYSFSPVSNSVWLPAGTVTLRFSSAGGTQYNINALNISSTSAQSTGSTVGSSATSVPVTSYSAISNSRIEYQNGLPDVGYVSPSGGYVEYTLNVQNAGNYNVSIGAAAPNWAQTNLSVNGTQAASYYINSTGAWYSFSPISNSVWLPAGTVTLRFSSAWGTQYNINALNISPASAPAASSSGSAGGFDASVSTQWMNSFNQLNIVAGSKNDSVEVSQSGSTITVDVNGVSNSYTGSYGDIVVKAGSGNDSITVDSSVWVDTLLYGGSGSDTLNNYTSGNATIVSIGGGYDAVTGNGKNTAYWVDSSDTVNASSAEWNAGDVHQISGFWDGVSTALNGQTLPEPTGTGATTTVPNASLWGTGPTMTDVNQGQVSDCFLVGALQTMAYTVPGHLRQLAVDLGDGTYAVQFKRGGTTTYVRVDGQLPGNGPYADGLEFAHPGASGDIWVPIIEKAYAEFRTGAWNYSSLNEGYFGAVFSDFGLGYTGFGAGNTNTIYYNIVNALNNGKGVTIGTDANITGGAPLIYLHTYTATAAWTDSSGTQWVQLRNPWGFDGAGNDSNTGDGLVTMTIGQLNQNLQAATVLT